MDELKGPNVQIVLHVKEGVGFGFLKAPFIVSGSLNGYMLETDPVVPCHAPVFDAELVWEADKRRFRSLRVQNVPVKVEVFTMGTQGRKDKVGYLLQSLLGAQPCPSNKFVDVKYSFHKLLGVKSMGKCCHPQLLMSLSVEDRTNTPTPRNELRIFHSNEVAYPSGYSARNPPSGKTILMTLNEYIAESKKTVSSPDLQPKLNCDEGHIQIGSEKHLFVLSFIIGAVENLDLLLPVQSEHSKESGFYFVTYSVFTHNITTDRVSASDRVNLCAVFNQRTSLQLRGSLTDLARYFAECPHLVTRVCAGDRDIGICSMDLRKLVPTEDVQQFINNFCNQDNALTIHERCFLLRCDAAREVRDGRRPYVDVEMSLKYGGVKRDKMPTILTARSASQLESGRKRLNDDENTLEYKSGSCTNLDQDIGGVAYTNITATNTTRYKNASGDTVIQTNEIAELIKKMYDSFTLSQEKLLAMRIKPTTSDMQVQCGPETSGGSAGMCGGNEEKCEGNEEEGAENEIPVATNDVESGGNGDNREVLRVEVESEPKKLETSKSDTCINQNEKDMVKVAISSRDRDVIMQKFVEELEEWKEKQQQLYKCQLKRKEDYHLELLAREWAKQRTELEGKLRRGIEQCRNLAADLSRATEDFRLRGYRNTERERKLLEAKKALEAHYTTKYQELREASQKMEDDMNHRVKMKDMTIEELTHKVQNLEKKVENLKNAVTNVEKEAESKYSGLTKDQTASLIQELRCLEEKLDSAVQSKAFFKEQWGRAVRELHLMKLSTRRQMLTQLQHDRRQLGEMGLDTIEDQTEPEITNTQLDMKKLKDDFYVDILANTPVIESNSFISTGPGGMDTFEENVNSAKNVMSDKLNELISQRDQLIQHDSPDEDQIKHLNHEIRTMLLNCGT